MVMGRVANELATGLAAHAEGCQELNDRITVPFYQHMRRRFAGEAPYRTPSFRSSQHCSKSEGLHTADFDIVSSTQTDSAADSADSGDVPDDILIVESTGFESWTMISAQLPEDWANHCD